MRTILLITSGLLLGMSATAFANCEKYEFAELNSMSADKLRLTYCLNRMELENQRVAIDLASKLIALEAKNPSGPKIREIERQGNLSSAANVKIEQCNHENGRIVSALTKKKVKMKAPEVECAT